MRLWIRLIAVSLVSSAATGTTQNEAAGNLPVVDLGYTRHRATYNVSNLTCEQGHQDHYIES